MDDEIQERQASWQREREAALAKLSSPDLPAAKRAALQEWLRLWDQLSDVDADARHADAWVLRSNAQRDALTAAYERATKRMLWGGGVLILGALLAAGSSLMADPGNSSYLFWSVVAWGAIQTVLGAVDRYRIRRAVDAFVAEGAAHGDLVTRVDARLQELERVIKSP